MATFDGFSINIGDNVFDITRGYGAVENISASSIGVRFQNRALISYHLDGRAKGVTYSQKILFWHNPVHASPFKDQAKWNTTKALCNAVIDVMRGV